MTLHTSTTNAEFAAATNLHFTMASRLRNGERTPSFGTVVTVMHAYKLSCENVVEWVKAIADGPEESGRWLRDNIFGP